MGRKEGNGDTRMGGIILMMTRYAFTDFFLGGCLGVGIQALSNMSVLGSLPLLNVPKAIDASKKQSVVMPAKKEESKKQDGPVC